jgi:hypothetical protein
MTRCAQGASLAASARKISCLTARICAGCMEKLRRPKPSSRRVSHIARPSRHTPPRLCPAHGLRRWCRPPGATRRGAGVVQVGHRFVRPVNRQRVLDQVVGAYGQEIKVLQEQRRLNAAAGISIMAPSLTGPYAAPVVQHGACMVQVGQRLADLAACASMGTSRCTGRAQQRAGWRAAASETWPGPPGSSEWRAGPARD